MRTPRRKIILWAMRIPSPRAICPGWIGIALLTVFLGGCAPRYYVFAPLDHVAEIDVSDGLYGRGRITDPKRVAAVVAYLNARRDRWFHTWDTFALTGDLTLLDSRKRQIASIAIGPGGMVQSRPGMRYRDAYWDGDFLLDWSDSSDRDEPILCALLGPENARIACSLDQRLSDSSPPCRCSDIVPLAKRTP